MTTTKNKLYTLALCALVAMTAGCNKTGKGKVETPEDLKAKAMLAGIWVDADEENVVFKVVGDSIFYPDSTSIPVKFVIKSDTIYLLGNSTTKYAIVKQSEHVFQFKTPEGDIIHLTKSEQERDSLLFLNHHQLPLNQNVTIKRDTVLTCGNNAYHCYEQVNPTTFKVFRSAYNDEGMDVENVYYDNIVHVSVFSGATKKFSRDFKKSDFASVVPENVLTQCILSDIRIKEAHSSGITYQAILAVPDSPTNFFVRLELTNDWKVSMSVWK